MQGLLKFALLLLAVAWCGIRYSSHANGFAAA
jgi:hypothetical protein